MEGNEVEGVDVVVLLLLPTLEIDLVTRSPSASLSLYRSPPGATDELGVGDADEDVSSIVKVAAVVVRVVVSLIVRLIVVVGSSVVAAEDGVWPCASWTDVDGEGDDED